ncbi:MAG: ABC transporter substrate-binding protein, partial [Candidatus Dormibacteria bacterium]
MSNRHLIDRRRFLRDTGSVLLATGGATAPLIALPSAAIAATSGDIPIGIMVPLTGGGAPYGLNMLKAVQLTTDAINKAGGPMGRPIKLYSEDSQT